VSENKLQDHIDRGFNNLEARMVRVESKLDDHLNRLSRAENSIEWLRGHATIVTTIVLAVAGFLAAMWANLISK